MKKGTWSQPVPKAQLICSAELRPGVEQSGLSGGGMGLPYKTSALKGEGGVVKYIYSLRWQVE